ncbi:MAG: HEAT repeat domain-containing protein, partial [Deltaproteobacteria bacterium]|nr:HEAT repeat domain-containing protein [Deltaproteobacteria bacterium]
MMNRRLKNAFKLIVTGAVLAAAFMVKAPPAEAQTPEQVYEKVVAALEPLLLGEPGEKIAAADALKKLRAVYSMPALAKALEDPSAKVRMAVVQTIGAIVHKSSVKILVGAALDKDVSVGVAAIEALGEMHTDEAYAGLTKLLGTVKAKPLKEAVLEGMRKWNKPFTPLPDPNTLPEGKKTPKLPEPEVEEPPPPAVTKPVV